MKLDNTLSALQQLISRCETCVLYEPLLDEIDYRDDSFPIEIRTDNLVLPNDKDNDPSDWAGRCITKFKSIKTYVLIPGTRFDTHGTRYGKGGGWYDRFLSQIPIDWLRIGVADKSQISNTKLPRQKWDEPVEWLIVRDSFAWNVYKTDDHL